ncbi:MAG: hypothetical protein ACRDOE_00165 [Streptosporangiaceae bacterium]
MCQPIIDTRPRRFGALTGRQWLALVSLTYGFVLTLQELGNEAQRSDRLARRNDTLQELVDEHVPPQPVETAIEREWRERQADAFVDALDRRGALARERVVVRDSTAPATMDADARFDRIEARLDGGHP